MIFGPQTWQVHHAVVEIINRLKEARRHAHRVFLRSLMSLFLRFFVLLRQAPRSFPDVDADDPEPLRHILAPGGQTATFVPLN